MRSFLIVTTIFLSSFFACPSFSADGANSAALRLAFTEDKHIRDRLLSEFVRWEGVKYKLGGNTRHGIDCSSLVQKIFHASFSDRSTERLPRTTTSQLALGKATSLDDLRPGDLVFFSLSAGERHVGMYIGEAQFIHASTSRGVMISNVDDNFWRKRFFAARRVLS